MTYPKNNNINEAIRQKPMNKYVYETDINKIYNIIVGQTNGQLKEKTSLVTTFQAINTGQDPIGYLIILKKICFSKQYEQHTIQSLCLATRRLYNTIKYKNYNTTNYLVRFLNV